MTRVGISSFTDRLSTIRLNIRCRVAVKRVLLFAGNIEQSRSWECKKSARGVGRGTTSDLQISKYRRQSGKNLRA